MVQYSQCAIHLFYNFELETGTGYMKYWTLLAINIAPSSFMCILFMLDIIAWITIRFGARVLGVGDTAIFSCVPHIRGNIQWLINGSAIDTLHIVNARRNFDDIALRGTLELSNLSKEFNETTIRCLAVDGSSVMLSPDTYTILIEG